MNKDIIVRLAKIALEPTEVRQSEDPFDRICRFAELVAAHEREECAKLENEPGIYSQWDMAAAIRRRNV